MFFSPDIGLFKAPITQDPQRYMSNNIAGVMALQRCYSNLL